MATRPPARPLPARAFAALVAVGLLLPLALAGCGTSAEDKASSGNLSSGQSGSAMAPQLRAGGSPEQSQAAADAAGEAAIAPPPGGSGVDASTIAAKLIVRNKTLRLEVKDVPAAIDKVRDLVKRDGGDISQMQVATTTDDEVYRPVDDASASTSSAATALRAFVTIRVPADKYQAFIDDAAKLGTVKFQTESAEDVTQQHVDLKARLDNLRAEEAQLREFFLKAKNVTEMLQIEQELSRVRGEIESLAAQVAYLERQAAMATVTIEMVEPKALVRPTGIDWGTREAFTKSVQAFVGTLNVLIVLLGPILALIVFVALPGFLIARAVWKRYKRRQATQTAAEGSHAPGDRSA